MEVRKPQMMPVQVRKWLRQHPKGLYIAGFDALVKRGDKSVNVGGGYVCREMFPPPHVRISHVLHFISFCDLFTDSPSYLILIHRNFMIGSGNFVTDLARMQDTVFGICEVTQRGSSW
jgi:hypothetical protein